MNISIIGAALGTSNMGVSALSISMIEGILTYYPDAIITVYDYQYGLKREYTHVFNGREYKYYRSGLISTKRIWKKESIFNLYVSGLLRLKKNPVLNAIKESDLVLSMTGGDSFTDLYGINEFKAGNQRKTIFLSNKVPLVLMPQTYGPFSTVRIKNKARNIILQAKMAWARDADSFEQLKSILSSDFNPNIHKAGVDIAFLLYARKPSVSIEEKFLSFRNDGDSPTIGLNISGLIYNDPNAKEKYGHIVNYNNVIEEITGKLLAEGTKIVFVSHVMSDVGEIESDSAACKKVVDKFSPQYASQMMLMTKDLDQSEVKWIISKCDWFCGTRMHSTIAGLSTGVPTATVAYSLKARGIFKLCNQEKNVGDLRLDSHEQIISTIINSYKSRERIKIDLLKNISAVIGQAKNQFKEILEAALRNDN